MGGGTVMRTVNLIKMADLAGRTVLLSHPRGKRSYWFRVDRVDSPSHPDNRGRLAYLWGTRLRSDGKPVTRQRYPVRMVFVREVLAVK